MAHNPHDDDDSGTGGDKTRLTLVPLPPVRKLSDPHREHLHGSGLTDETIELAKLYTEHRSKVIAELLHRRSFARHMGAGLIFPLYLPGDDEPYAYRVRPTQPRKDPRGKVIKYEQASAIGVLVYFPPRARRDGYRGEAPLHWVEGEKKALVIDQLGLVCIGLTGVWNWLDAKHRDDAGEWRIHPVIREHVALAGRRHIICFDSDAHENDQVMHAAQRLAGALLAAGATSVLFTTPPTRDHKGIDDYYAAFGDSPTRAVLDAAGPIQPLDVTSPFQLASSIKALKGAPISDKLRIPEGYEIRKDCTLWKSGDGKHGDTKIASSPILIVRQLEDHASHAQRTEITYLRDESWITLMADRGALIDARTMVKELGSYGAPVTSNSAPKIVDFFEELERINAGRIDRAFCVGKTGWHTIDGEQAFVLDRPIFADSGEHTLTLDTRGDRKRMFAALKPRGSLHKHIAALRTAWETDPICAAMIAGALAASLLEPLSAPNFAIHLPGDSSRGKTSMLKIAASVFGDPNNDQWLGSWNTTGVASELRASVLNDLPQCYDEVGSGDAQSLERSVYMLINGGGRARGKADLSLRETLTWRTVVLSTGERELADANTMTGAQVRVIQLPVRAFGDLDARAIDELRDACAAESGMFGRAWVEQLLSIDDWSIFRTSLRAATKQLRTEASNSLQARVAGYFATLMTAEAIAAPLGIGDPEGGTMRRLYLDAERREMVQPLADRAFELVRDWVMQEQEAFPELLTESSGYEEPKRTGKTRYGFRRGTSQVLFIPKSLKDFLDSRKLSSATVLGEWRRRGWIECDAAHFDKLVRLGRSRARLIVLSLDNDEASA